MTRTARVIGRSRAVAALFAPGQRQGVLEREAALVQRGGEASPDHRGSHCVDPDRGRELQRQLSGQVDQRGPLVFAASLGPEWIF